MAKDKGKTGSTDQSVKDKSKKNKKKKKKGLDVSDATSFIESATLKRAMLEIEIGELERDQKKVELSRARWELERDKFESMGFLQSDYTLMKADIDAPGIVTTLARLSGAVDEYSVERARTQLYHLTNLVEPGGDIWLDINSPGGYVNCGMELYGVLREISDGGWNVITRISGHAASAAGVVAQGGDTRFIRNGSYLHLHEAASLSYGKASEMTEDAQRLESISKDIANVYFERSLLATGFDESYILEILDEMELPPSEDNLFEEALLTADAIYKRFHRREWWLDASQAVALGFADEVV